MKTEHSIHPLLCTQQNAAFLTTFVLIIIVICHYPCPYIQGVAFLSSCPPLHSISINFIYLRKNPAPKYVILTHGNLSCY